jgi:hypothetical protein
MRFITFLVAAMGALVNAAISATSLENPIVPIEGTLTAGKPATIKWTPTTAGTITLSLRSGDATHLGPPTTIAGMYLIWLIY